MLLEIAVAPKTGNQEFRITLEVIDMIVAPLDQIDFALLRECSASDSIADKLLGLECIARRLEQLRGAALSTASKQEEA